MISFFWGLICGLIANGLPSGEVARTLKKQLTFMNLLNFKLYNPEVNQQIFLPESWPFLNGMIFLFWGLICGLIANGLPSGEVTRTLRILSCDCPLAKLGSLIIVVRLSFDRKWLECFRLDDKFPFPFPLWPVFSATEPDLMAASTP